MRKIIQIVNVPATTTYDRGGLYALCDDGSIWYCEIGPRGFRESNPEWQRVPGPPAEDTVEPPPYSG